MKTHGEIFAQCLLCLLLIALCLTVKYRESTAVSQAGTFGFTNENNDTFSHLAKNLYHGVCNE